MRKQKLLRHYKLKNKNNSELVASREASSGNEAVCLFHQQVRASLHSRLHYSALVVWRALLVMRHTKLLIDIEIHIDPKNDSNMQKERQRLIVQAIRRQQWSCHIWLALVFPSMYTV